MHSLVKYWLIGVGIIISIVGLTSGCGTGPDTFTSGQWQQAGLENKEVKTIAGTDHTILSGGQEGLFKQHFNTNNHEWKLLGFEKESNEVRDLIIFSESKMMLTIWIYNSSSVDPVTFYESDDGGNSWSAVETVLKGQQKNIGISHLEPSHKSDQTLYAYNGSIIQSNDNGHSWDSLFTGHVSRFLTTSPYHPNHVWTGGLTSIYSPYLAKSEDGGDTWTLLNQQVYTGSDGTVHDAILHPENADNILIAMAGIQRSTDGGQTWQPVFEGAGISTFTHSARNPEVVYASGENADGTLFFAASRDFGDSWQMVEWKDGPAGLEVNDMDTVIVDGREVLYLGTNNGVFTYRFEE